MSSLASAAQPAAALRGTPPAAPLRQPLHRISRLVVAFAAVALGVTYFVPLWKIQLWAPQYPEGLTMKFWLNRITGDHAIINGINHYIGMKQIKAEMFPEFKVMGPLVAVLIGVGLVPAFTRRLRWLQVFAGLLCLCGVVGMLDYYRWGYDYGHDLDPKAAISIPGMSYDPPLIGYKSLLNFVAYSGPDIGGWIFITVGFVAVGLVAFERWRTRGRPGQT
jgi:copper chaperone NosL